MRVVNILLELVLLLNSTGQHERCLCISAVRDRICAHLTFVGADVAPLDLVYRYLPADVLVGTSAWVAEAGQRGSTIPLYS